VHKLVKNKVNWINMHGAKVKVLVLVLVVVVVEVVVVRKFWNYKLRFTYFYSHIRYLVFPPSMFKNIHCSFQLNTWSLILVNTRINIRNIYIGLCSSASFCSPRGPLLSPFFCEVLHCMLVTRGETISRPTDELIMWLNV